MDKIIAGLREGVGFAETAGIAHEEPVQIVAAAARRLEEVRMFLERFAADEPPPQGCTYEEWAKELLV